MQKRGQSAGSAAILVAAIAGFILLYILSIPPEDRDGLLGQNNGSAVISGIGENSRILLLEHPGTLSVNKQDSFEHNINSFNLFSRSNDQIIKSFDNIYVESKSGNKNTKKTFEIGRAHV